MTQMGRTVQPLTDQSSNGVIELRRGINGLYEYSISAISMYCLGHDQPSSVPTPYTKATIDLIMEWFVLAHGVLMTTAVLLFLPVGIIIARYRLSTYSIAKVIITTPRRASVFHINDMVDTNSRDLLSYLSIHSVCLS